MSGVLATLRTLPTGQRSKGGSIKRLLCVVAGVVLAGILAATVVAGTTKTITGTRKAEVLMVTQGADVINALAGNDKLRGLGGNDTLNGGPGQDVLSGGAGDDVLNGGARKDVMTGGAGKDRYLCTAGDVVHADIADTIPPACTNVIGLPAPAQASVVDASAPEGDTGTKVLSFPVTLAAASPYVVTISFATADGTATAGSDYVAANGSLTFQPRRDEQDGRRHDQRRHDGRGRRDVHGHALGPEPRHAHQELGDGDDRKRRQAEAARRPLRRVDLAGVRHLVRRRRRREEHLQPEPDGRRRLRRLRGRVHRELGPAGGRQPERLELQRRPRRSTARRTAPSRASWCCSPPASPARAVRCRSPRRTRNDDFADDRRRDTRGRLRGAAPLVLAGCYR
jgi:hypothetical protein